MSYIFCHLQDIVATIIQFFILLVNLRLPLGVTWSKCHKVIRLQNTRMLGLFFCERILTIHLAVLYTTGVSWTDVWTELHLNTTCCIHG